MTSVNFNESEKDLFLESSAICRCWRYLKRRDLKKNIYMTNDFQLKVTSMTAVSYQYSHWSPQWPLNLSGWRRSWDKAGTRGPHHDVSESTGPPDSSPGGIPSPGHAPEQTPSCCNSILSLCPIWSLPSSFQKIYNQVSASTFPGEQFILKKTFSSDSLHKDD